MVKPINKDVFSLNRKAEKATRADLQTARDLLDTLMANRERCVGMAANMIGVNRRIIALYLGPFPMVMLNPELLWTSPETYETMEGCLSLPGERPARRYESIELRYQDLDMETHRQRFSGFPAQIIQHELDHCEGILT